MAWQSYGAHFFCFAASATRMMFVMSFLFQQMLLSYCTRRCTILHKGIVIWLYVAAQNSDMVHEFVLRAEVLHPELSCWAIKNLEYGMLLISALVLCRCWWNGLWYLFRIVVWIVSTEDFICCLSVCPKSFGFMYPTIRTPTIITTHTGCLGYGTHHCPCFSHTVSGLYDFRLFLRLSLLHIFPNTVLNMVWLKNLIVPCCLGIGSFPPPVVPNTTDDYPDDARVNDSGFHIYLEN